MLTLIMTRRAQTIVAITYVMALLASIVAVYHARLWLAPDGMQVQTLVLLASGFGMVLIACLFLVQDRHRRIEAGVLAIFLVLWIAAWRPESRSLGLFLGGAVLFFSCSRKRLINAFGIAAIIAAVAFSGYERNYGVLDVPAAQAVLQTYADEATAFILQEITPIILMLCVLLLGAYVALLRLAMDDSGCTRLRWVGISMLVLSLPFAIPEGLAKGKLVWNAYALLQAEQGSAQPPEISVIHTSQRAPLDVVLMLGESTSKRLWRLYGAPVDSNPQLQAIREKVLVFNDVVSIHSHTVQSVTGMMYRDLRDIDNPGGDSGTAVSLIEVLHQAGVRTEWVSAQPRFGKFSGRIARLADRSHTALFVKKNSTTGFAAAGLEQAPDQQANAAVIESITNGHHGPRLIVQHLLAIHWPYCSHRMKEDQYRFRIGGRAWFGSGTDNTHARNCYVSATRFIDQQIAQVAAAIERSNKPGIVLFVPDHGEDPEGATGHASSLHVSHHVEVPLVVIFNEAARRIYRDKFVALQANTTAPFLNAWVFELMLDLFGLEVEGIRTQVTSLASTRYRPLPRTLFPGDTPIKYDEAIPGDRKDALEWTRLNLRAVRQDGTWKAPLYALRVNTMGKALDAKHHFDGIEMNIVYDVQQQDLFVYDPPSKNINLRLYDQLTAIADKADIRVWLDIKNVNAAQIRAVHGLLDRIDKAYHIKGRAILEIPSTAMGAGIETLAQGGWQIAHSVPSTLSKCRAGGDASAELCRKEAEQLIFIARQMHARHLSFDYSLMSAIKRYLLPIKGEIGLLARSPATNSADANLPDELSRMPLLDGLSITLPSNYN